MKALLIIFFVLFAIMSIVPSDSPLLFITEQKDAAIDFAREIPSTVIHTFTEAKARIQSKGSERISAVKQQLGLGETPPADEDADGINGRSLIASRH